MRANRPIIRPNLDEAIRSRGMNYVGFAKLCGVNNTTVTQWLRDPVVIPRRSQRLMAANVLGVPEDYLFLTEGVN